MDWLDPGKIAGIIHMTYTNNEQTNLKFFIIQRPSPWISNQHQNYKFGGGVPQYHLWMNWCNGF